MERTRCGRRAEGIGDASFVDESVDSVVVVVVVCAVDIVGTGRAWGEDDDEVDEEDSGSEVEDKDEVEDAHWRCSWPRR